jgi:hypothetical protein
LKLKTVSADAVMVVDESATQMENNDVAEIDEPMADEQQDEPEADNKLLPFEEQAKQFIE